MKYGNFKKSLKESSVIELSDLDVKEKATFTKFMQSNKLKFLDLFDGIHGKILMVNTTFSGHMNSKEAIALGKILTNATKLKTFRWIAIDSDINGTKTTRISIGL